MTNTTNNGNPYNMNDWTDIIAASEDLVKAIKMLDDEDKAIIRKHYFEGVSIRSLAVEYGYKSPRGIQVRLESVYRKLRQYIG